MKQLTIEQIIQHENQLINCDYKLGDSLKKRMAVLIRDSLVELQERRKSDITELVKNVHQNAKEHGWWDEERSFGDIIALCHAELSEALEEHRNGRKPNEIYYHVAKGGRENNDKPEGIPIELADVIIRIFDYCGYAGIDIEAAIVEKMEFNKTRPFKHGGKVI